ncbi:MAG TPA: sigma factor-like helix-turn-helix DNA-binding protein [Candidatus Sulfotelmatobacter sp.]|nr:sigma factor-like helix-turn-helix DNA-binding protein [Candidatus Sulfotelmatobacter sp.]
MDGTLKKVAQAVRDHIRTTVDRANRHAKIELAEHEFGSDDSDQSGILLAERTGDLSVSHVGYAKVLFEQFISVLEPRDRNVVELCVVERRTQDEVGAILGVGQSLVSKRQP